MSHTKKASTQRVTLAIANDLKALTKSFQVRSIAQVVERLLLDYEAPANRPSQLPRNKEDTYTQVTIYLTDIECLKRLRLRYDFEIMQDVIAHLVDNHLYGSPPVEVDKGEQTFMQILDYIKRKERAERVARKAQRLAEKDD